MLPVEPFFYSYARAEQDVPKLTREKIKIVEGCKELQIVEKINIIALFCGYKWITDIAIGRPQTKKIENVLNKLGLPFSPNYYYHENTKYEWLQVAINKPILSYVIDRRNQLTVLEAGVLYGYPVSAALAYIGLLKKAGFDKSIAEYYLSGVFSDTLTGKEREHFKQMWDEIMGYSNTIRLVAEKEFADSRS